MNMKAGLLCLFSTFFVLASEAADFNSSVAAGYTHTLFTKTDGSLWTTGRNNYGQLGDGTTTDRNASAKIVDANVTAVAAGQYHSLYLESNGSLWSFGRNNYGQLGDGTTDERHSPVRIADVNVTAVAAFGTHSLYLKNDGTLWAFGRNNYGQLGDGSTTDRSTPVQVLTGVSSMAAGFNHSLAVKTDGSLHAFGRNHKGQLGDGTTTDRNASVQIEASGVSAAAAGQYHSLYLKTDGSLRAMGWNQYGQLGDGTTTDRNSSVQVESLFSAVSLIRAGNVSSYFVNTSGTLKSFGRNNYGQLGDSSTTDRNSSVTVESNASSVAAGQYFVMILANDNSLRAFGRNNYGQFGDGTTTDRNVSVEVVSANAMQPKTLTVTVAANASDGAVTASGDFNGTTLKGTYDKNTVVNLTASFSSTGFLFSGWSGDLSGTSLTPTLTLSDHRSVTATFSQDTGDTDEDGLSNYAELVTHSTNPNDSDSDDDTLSDAEEVQIGTDPSTANTALVAFFDGRESTARIDGINTGIADVQANPSTYTLYTETEKNASDATQYASGKSAGITDGNASGIAYVQANPSTYTLYTETEKTAAESTSTASGKAEALATVQADLASQGLALLTYIDQMEKSTPYTQEWFYQPGMGWLWTQTNIFPFVYQAPSGEQAGGWLYFSQLADQTGPSFYDYASETWISPSVSD